MNSPRTYTHASLFSGIGGFDLAARWMGWDNTFHCEINPFCLKVLRHHFKESESYEDIIQTDFRKWKGKVDVLSGGFPCQPFSVAGQRRGAEDNRYLWPQMLRAIREINPTWVVGENVAGIITMVQPGTQVEVERSASLFGEGYTEQEHRQQYVIETICRDLEQEGYSVQPMLIPACAVGAPHKRDRIWFIAHRADAGIEGVQQGGTDGVHAAVTASDTERIGRNKMDYQVQPEQPNGNWADGNGFERFVTDSDSNRRWWGKDKQEQFSECEGASGNCIVCEDWAVADTDGKQSERCEPEQHCNGSKKQGEFRGINRKIYTERTNIPNWRNFPTQSPVRRRYDGISENVVRYINDSVYEEMQKHYRSEDLSCLWKILQQEEIRNKIGGLYEIPQPDLLLKVLQRTSHAGRLNERENILSPYSEETSERVLRYMRKYGKFGCSPLGQKYKEQFRMQFGDTMPQMSHEIALATKKIVEECEITASMVRRESIKAYGNAIVPQVAYEIFKAIELCR